MRRYCAIILAVAAAVMLSACSEKSGDPMTDQENIGAMVQSQQEKRTPVIQILDETQESTKQETSARESTEAPDAKTLQQKAAGASAAAETKGTGETKGISETTQTGKKEASKSYSVQAFEKTMYATASVNVRASYTTQSAVIAGLMPGERVKVSGRSANGWMRINYSGKDAFVYQKYLSESAPRKNVTATGLPKNNTTAMASSKREQSQETGVMTYPGNLEEDPVKSPGEIPLVPPAPIMPAPKQSGPQSSSVTSLGPGMITPGAGSGVTESVMPGSGPGM